MDRKTAINQELTDLLTDCIDTLKDGDLSESAERLLKLDIENINKAIANINCLFDPMGCVSWPSNLVEKY
jgi:hypothetical protein